MKRFVLAVLLPAVVACSGNAGGSLPARQRAEVELAARAGDLAAIKRMIAHYEAGGEPAVEAERWRERACELGDAQELYFHATRRFVAAEVEHDEVERRRLLLEAHHAALRAQASRPEQGTALLVKQISHSLDAR